MAWVDIANGENAGSVRNKINALGEQVSAISGEIEGLDATNINVSLETAELYGVENVDEALGRTNLSSYLAFCGNVNADSLDAAFGKNNEDRLLGIGRQLAMYAWFKGDSKITYSFTNLIQCNTVIDCLSNDLAMNEVRNNSNLSALFLATPYITDNIGVWKKNADIMSNLLLFPSMINKIRTTTVPHDILHSERTVITATGSGQYAVPEGVTSITVCCIAGGSPGIIRNTGTGYLGDGGASGELTQKVYKVTQGQIFDYIVGTDGQNTTFGDLTALTGQGNSTTKTKEDGLLIKKSGNGADAFNSGVTYKGGFGGYGGGNGTKGLPSSDIGVGSEDIGTGGGGLATTSSGSGGGGYGGGGGGGYQIASGGSGAIVIFK